MHWFIINYLAIKQRKQFLNPKHNQIKQSCGAVPSFIKGSQIDVEDH